MAELYVLHFPNGKCYVGITGSTTETRYAQHFREAYLGNSSKAVHCAMRKYGVPRVVPVLSGSLEQMKEWEQLMIAEMRTLAPGGYNLTAGGDGVRNYDFSSADRVRMSESRKGNKNASGKKWFLSDETRQRMCKPKSEATRQRMREAWIQRRAKWAK